LELDLAHLPEGWILSENCSVPFNVAGLRLHLSGLVAQYRSGVKVMGSAGSETVSESSLRATFELYERIGIIESENETSRQFSVFNRQGKQISSLEHKDVFYSPPDGCGYLFSKSNGVAARVQLGDAIVAAEKELVERDRVLRSWYGEFSPEPISCDFGSLLPIAMNKFFDLKAVQFQPLGGLSVAMVAGLPKSNEVPLVFGFGAGNNLEQALLHARSEMNQRIGFLWGEELPSESPQPELTPHFHQDYYLYPSNHDRFIHWISGGGIKGVEFNAADSQQTRWIDITPVHLRGKMYIVKAMNLTLMPLTFGLNHPWVKKSFAGVHPFC